MLRQFAERRAAVGIGDKGRSGKKRKQNKKDIQKRRLARVFCFEMDALAALYERARDGV